MRATTLLVIFIAILTVVVALVGAALLLPRVHGPLELGGSAVGLVHLSGEIGFAEEFLDGLERMAGMRRVRALVVRIDSPGGPVGATQEIYGGLLRYREQTGHPIVASVGDVAASGGYYAACAADRIVANPGSVTGSIGVILSFTDAEGLLEKIGLRVHTIKSGAMKDQGAYWRGLTDEERTVLQSTVDDVHEQFVEVIRDARGIEEAQLRELADGRLLSGRQARRAGLVDSLGDLETALALARSLAGLAEDASVIEHRQKEPGLFDLLFGHGGRLPLGSSAGPKLEYRFGFGVGGEIVGAVAR